MAMFCAAAHQGLDALAELLDADHEVVEGQHHAGQPLDLRHLVEQARDRGVGADQARAAERHAGAALDAAGGRSLGRILVAARLGAAPFDRLVIGAGDVVLPLGHRRRVGLVGDDHGERQRLGVGAGRGGGRLQLRHRIGAVTRIVDLPRAAAEVVGTELRGEGDAGIAGPGADQRDLPRGQRPQAAIVHGVEFALEIGVAGRPQLAASPSRIRSSRS